MFEIVDGVLVNYTGNEEYLTLPSEVKEIKPLIFRTHPELREIDLSNTSVENILTKTFFECKNVYRIVLPDCLKVIGYQAFSNCQSLEELIIPEGIEEIMSGAFEECSSLISIKVPSSIKKIEMNLFKNCSHLERITLSDGLIKIGESAFENCIKLIEINLPKTLRVLDMFAFRNCRELPAIVIPKSIKVIPRGCFYSCIRLQTVILHDEIEKLDDWSFRECFMLDKVNAPATCKISPCAFLDSKTVNEPIYKDKFAIPKKQKCYIATCVYNSYETKELFVLRRYRDKCLRRTWYGRLFIKFYYFNAPIVIKLFGKMKWFNKLWRKILDRKVKKLIKKGYLDSYYEDIK
ncbi:MAG: leucine-rich repeat domain-containing protein [Acholeplasmatales bacterium]|nr:leucine-rich repeat domain-containing protein [Acholeplasmatales bacterium]